MSLAARDTLLTRLATVISSYNQFSLSTELPFVAGGTALFSKNMKTVYVDEAQTEDVEYIRTLDKRDVDYTDTVIIAYVAVDAKNKPTQTNNMLVAIEAAKSAIAPVINSDTVLSTEIQDDTIVYSVEYRIRTI
jgi:hypothetical protein